MSRIVNIPPPKKPEPKREFLTEPKSWLKLGIGLVLVVVLLWFNLRPPKQIQQNKIATKNPTSQGKVAGVESKRIEPAISIPSSENPAATTLPTQTQDEESLPNPQTVKPVVKPVPKPQLPPKLTGPTKAETALAKLIPGDYTLETLFDAGKDYLQQNKLSQAELVYTRATEIAPEYRDAWYLLGYTYLKEFEQNPELPKNSFSKAQRAVITLTRATTIDPLAQNVKDLLNIAQKITNK